MSYTHIVIIVGYITATLVAFLVGLNHYAKKTFDLGDMTAFILFWPVWFIRSLARSCVKLWNSK